MKDFDYIIVGAGSAGCVLAHRLSEDPDNRVLLLEAGGRDSNPFLRMPLAFLRIFMRPELNWGYWSEPEPLAGNRRLPLPRGKLLGGSSSTNGMVYARGHPRDFDDWRDMGLPGWGFADVLPYFKRSEANWRGETDYHGGSGPLTVSRHRSDSIILPRLMRAAEAFGWKATEDFHGASTEGIGLPDFTIDRRGRRASTAAAFLRPAERRPNLLVETSAVATRLLIEKNRIVGLEYAKAGALQCVRSGREVVLAGGAYNSPHLLMLSGIGPADELREAGIVPVHDLPGVGRNLQEHAIAGLAWDATGPVAFESHLRFDRMTISVLEWALFGTGIASRLPVTAMAFYKTRPELDRPDIKGNFYPTIMDSRLWFPLLRQGRGHVLSMFNLLLRPQSRGWVRLKSADPAVHPRIRLNLLAESRDIEVLRDATRMIRELFEISPLRDLVRKEVMPGGQVRTNQEIDDWVRATVVIAQHPVGTCKMGVGEDAVVDAQLKLRGMEGLRVADASVMPVIVGANTNAPVIMIAEKASDMILG